MRNHCQKQWFFTDFLVERTFTDENSDFFTDFLVERTFTDQNSDFFTDFFKFNMIIFFATIKLFFHVILLLKFWSKHISKQ